MKKRFLGLLFALCLVAGLMPIIALGIGPCPHHQAHDGACGYQAATQPVACGHRHTDACLACIHTQHDDNCGWSAGSAAVPCNHTHSASCSICNHAHDGACGYNAGTAGKPCIHSHDSACGYAEAVHIPASPCTHECIPFMMDGTCIDENGKCTHAHDSACGYAEAVDIPASPCTHSHNGECGYQEEIPSAECVHEHTSACYAAGTDCIHTCGDGTCSYREAVSGSACTHEHTAGCYGNCTHTRHDSSCGYSEGSAEVPCAFVCAICDHVHTYADTWSSDSTGHWYAATCEHTEEISGFAAHTEVTDAAVAATCTATGLTEGKHCAVCNAVLVAQQTTPALGHTEVTDAAVAATCTATGLTEGKHCSVCNAVLVAQQTTPALGHTEVTDAAVAATCTATGLTEGKHCSVCNAVLVAQQTTPALGHTEVTTPYGELGEHVFGWLGKVDEENHQTVCDVCTGVYGEKKPHSLDHYECIYTKSGHIAVCADCKGEYGEVQPHELVFEQDIAYDGLSPVMYQVHKINCKYCGYGESARCSGGTATCRDKAVCDTCKFPYGELAPHTWRDWVNAGNFHYRVCTVRGCSGREDAMCSGGTATCQAKAVCDTCKSPYGEYGAHWYKGETFIELRDGEPWHNAKCRREGCNESREELCELETDDNGKRYCTECGWGKENAPAANQVHVNRQSYGVFAFSGGDPTAFVSQAVSGSELSLTVPSGTESVNLVATNTAVEKLHLNGIELLRVSNTMEELGTMTVGSNGFTGGSLRATYLEVHAFSNHGRTIITLRGAKAAANFDRDAQGAVRGAANHPGTGIDRTASSGTAGTDTASSGTVASGRDVDAVTGRVDAGPGVLTIGGVIRVLTGGGVKATITDGDAELYDRDSLAPTDTVTHQPTVDVLGYFDQDGEQWALIQLDGREYCIKASSLTVQDDWAADVPAVGTNLTSSNALFGPDLNPWTQIIARWIMENPDSNLTADEIMQLIISQLD